MKYKGWLILSIILGFFWTPIWIASVIIAVAGIYADKKKIVRKIPLKRKKVKRKVKKKR